MGKVPMNLDAILAQVENQELSIEDSLHVINGLFNKTADREQTPQPLSNSTLCYFHTQLQPSELLNSVHTVPVSGCYVILDQQPALAEDMRRFLSKTGDSTAQVIWVKPGVHFRQMDDGNFELDPLKAADYISMLEGIANGRQQSEGSAALHIVLHQFQSITQPAGADAEFYPLLYVVKALKYVQTSHNASILRLAQGTDFSSIFGLEAAAGFARALQQEDPQLVCKALHTDTATGTEGYSRLLLDELVQSAAPDPEVRYIKGERYVPVISPMNPAGQGKNKLPVQDNGIYIITGGMGGIGYSLASSLAEQARIRLLLIGRSELTDVMNGKLEQLRAKGSAAVYIQADVSNELELQSAVQEALTGEDHADGYGIRGIIHCAGVIKDGYLWHKRAADAADVLAPKIQGVHNLDRLTEREPLDFFILFSSIVASLGNAGQADYAYANGYMDEFAGCRHLLVQAGQRSGRSLSIQWPVWAEGGMKAPQDEFSRFTGAGLVAMPTERGIEALEKAYASGHTKVIVGFGEPHRVQEALQPVYETPAGLPQVKEDLLQRMVSDSSVLQSHTERMLADTFAGLLKIQADSLSPEASLAQLGIDSFLVNRFNYLMKKTFGKIPATLLYEYDSIRSLAGYLIRHYPELLASQFSGHNGETPPVQEAEQTQQALPPIAPQPVKLKIEKEEKSRVNMQEIAVIGVSGRYPQAENLEQLWQNLCSGKDCITEIPEERWNWKDYYDADPAKAKEGKIYGKWGGFIDGFDQFDPLLFHISPREAKAMDPQERLFLEVSREVMEDAGYGKKLRSKQPDSGKGNHIGVFVGATSNTYSLWAPDSWQQSGSVLPQSMPWSIANRVSYTFNFTGPSMPVDTACSSSLTAIHLASDSIRRGECSMAIAGGVNLYLHPLKYLYLSQMKMLSTSGSCRSFGGGGDGFVPGEGAGAVLLKPLQAAIEDGDHIYAVIKSSAINHGGHTSGYTVPSPKAQAALIQDALAKAGVHPRTMSVIEAHGTGTSLGDPIEISGLCKAFEAYTNDKQFCSIGSVKSSMGHLEAAAGILSLTKVILQLKHKMLVPSLHADPPNPNIDFGDTPFYVQKELAEWKPAFAEVNGAEETQARRAGISSFGAGGVNAHLIVEEYTRQEKHALHKGNSAEPQLFVLSAVNEERLKLYADRVAEYVHALLSGTENGKELSSHQAASGQEAERDFIALVAAAAGIHVEEVKLDGDIQEYNLDLYAFTEIAGKLIEKHGLEQSIPELLPAASLRDCLQAFSFAPSRPAPRSQQAALAPLSDIAYSLQCGREELNERLAFTASSYNELYDILSSFAAGKQQPEKVYTGNILQDRTQLLNLLDGPEGGHYINELLDHKRLDKLARLWSWGFMIEWERLYKNPPHRVSLPAYPFARDRYWFDMGTDKGQDKDNQRSTGGVNEMRSYPEREEVELTVSEDGYAIVTLRDRDNRNMYSEGINEGLLSAFARINGNEQIKAVIVTGSDKVFCMGGTAENLNSISNMESKCTDLSFVYQGFLQCKVPVIAAMQGHAMGGGLVLGLFADIVIMAEEGVYSANFTQYGFTPGVGATYILREKLGSALAMEMMFTARSFTGEELQKRGASLIFRESDYVLHEAAAVAKMLVKKPYQTLTVLKQELAGRALAQLPAILQSEVTMHDTVFASIDVSGLINHYTRTETLRPELQTSAVQAKTLSQELPRHPEPDNSKAVQTGNPAPVKQKLKLKTAAAAERTEVETRAAAPRSVTLSSTQPQQESSAALHPQPVIHAAPEPQQVFPEMDEARIASSLQEMVGSILHIPARDVGMELSFHEMGFDSISGVELVRDINRQLPVNVDSIIIYDYPNIRDLAKLLLEEILPAPSRLTSQAASAVQQQEAPVLHVAETGPVSFAGQQIDRGRRRAEKQKLPAGTQEHPINAGSPQTGNTAVDRPSVAEIKQSLAAMIAHILHLPLASLSTQTALRELGVDSITTVEMVRDVNRTFRIQLDAVTIYDYPTIDQLAVCVFEELSMNSGSQSVQPQPALREQQAMNWLAELEAGQLNIEEVEKLLEDIS